MDNIYFFIKKEILFILIITLVLINPFFYGYRIALLFSFLLLFNFDYYTSVADRNVLYLFFFAMSYEFFAATKVDYIEKGIVSVVPNVFVPSITYLVGRYISEKYRGNRVRIFTLFYLSVVFSIIPLISIFSQIQENGFIYGTRSMYLFWDKNRELGATGLANYFVLNISMIGIVNVNKTTKYEYSITMGMIILFVLSLVCVLRLGSRTQIVLALVSLLASFLLNLRQQSLFRNVLFVLFFGILVNYLRNNINENSEIVNFFIDRIDDDDSGVGSAGGRTDRWLLSLKALFTDPFGWEYERFGHAHNLWLDVARIAGIVPFAFLSLFTMSSVVIWIKNLKFLENSVFLRSYIFVLFISVVLYFNVEPIMEGAYLLFLLFCFFIGFLKGILS